MFQSLSGFQVRCNSIKQIDGIMSMSRCFNPYRVFKFVATQHIRYGTKYRLITFQSLSGFQVRCNADLSGYLDVLTQCFNPYRVFKFVATIDSADGNRASGWGFNPYRVFKFVATFNQKLLICPRKRSFNPYRVFKFVATLIG